VSPRRFTAPAVGSGGCRQADLRGIGFHGRGVRGAAWQGADYIRTHDVAAARDAFTVLAAIARESAASRVVRTRHVTRPSSGVRQSGEASAGG